MVRILAICRWKFPCEKLEALQNWKRGVLYSLSLEYKIVLIWLLFKQKTIFLPVDSVNGASSGCLVKNWGIAHRFSQWGLTSDTALSLLQPQWEPFFPLTFHFFLQTELCLAGQPGWMCVHWKMWISDRCKMSGNTARLRKEAGVGNFQFMRNKYSSFTLHWWDVDSKINLNFLWLVHFTAAQNFGFSAIFKD